ncbi:MULTISPECIES: DUF4331 family protein [Streptomyces]|uniref:DUF4331 family protein n=1 Tax=Streptomyces TaxID=1883 RepID=UPI0036A126B7
MDDGRLDMTDLFAFTADGDRTVLIMNANPVAPTMGDSYHPDAVYRINVDTDGDHQADVAFSFVFSEHRNGRQTFTLYRADGEQARSHEAGGHEVVTDEPVAFGPEPEIIVSGPSTRTSPRTATSCRSSPTSARLIRLQPPERGPAHDDRPGGGSPWQRPWAPVHETHRTRRLSDSALAVVDQGCLLPSLAAVRIP